MAPIRKRLRAENEEVLAVESASSNFQQDAQRKKVRLSTAVSSSKPRSQRDRSRSSSDSDEDIPDEDDEPAAPASTQYEIHRDNGFKHLENPDFDDQRATQKFLERQEKRKQLRQRIGNNRAADNAIIQEITCINFMCHDKLHVTLGPLINFVVGHNGSGKSAVLTAITLCLGGKVGATSRGNNLKSLIKGDRDQAILIIKLKNEGNDAFQPDVFGESIIIERHFSRASPASFKLKTSTGRIVSTKRTDVDDVVEYFQLQVDNPMNVLTQDAAKSFITSSTPAAKYKFFVEGVQLQALDHDYKLISDTCDSISDRLRGSQDDIAGKKKRAEEARRKAEVALQHEGLRKKAKELGYKLAWSQVLEMETILTERVNRVTESQRNLENAENVVKEKDVALQRIDETLQRAVEAARNLEDELIPLKEEEDSHKTDYDSAKVELTRAHQQSKDIKRNMTTVQNKIDKFKQEILDEEKKLEEANGGAHIRKLAEIQEAERACTDARTAVKGNEEKLPDLQIKKDEAQRILAEIDRKLLDKRIETKAAQESLEALNRDRGDIMAGFHNSIPRILQTIREDSGFAETPVGPLALHIGLRDPAWSNILESQMGQALNGFVVTSKVDEQRLSKLLERMGVRFFTPIFIVNREAIQRLEEPDPEFQTILRTLNIDNDLVRNALIITQAIEQQILIKRREDGINVMFEGPRPPRNVKRCFTFHDTQRSWGLNIGFSGRGGRGRAIEPIKPPKGKPRMKTDIESRINDQREAVNEHQQQQASLENEKRQAQTLLQMSNQAIVQHKRDHGTLKIQVQRAEEDLDKLRAELAGIDVEDGCIEALKENLREAEDELNICQESYGNSRLEVDTLNNTSSERKRALESMKTRVGEHEFKLKKAKDKVKNIGEARKLVLSEKNSAIENIETAKARLAHLEQKRETTAAQVTDFTEQAQQVCDRVELEAGETHQSLAAAQDKIKLHLAEYRRKQGGSDQQIFDAAEQADTVYKTAEKTYTELNELLAVLKDSFVRRLEMFRRFQQHISAASRINFNYLLSERAFRGKLTIDHKAKKLDVHVEPDETNKSGKGRQTKTLSGGEKSFSSICLLLALWEAMSAPLRCLDEFDVFMDDVNRDVSTKMIISAARCSVGRQFILITPKALGAGVAEGADDVHIIKLFDPRENQRRIDEYAS